MQKLYESGADIHYSSTRGIVGMDFFRNDIANWFMPFVPDNPDIGIDFTTEQGKVLKGLILFNSEHCDFDSYALCLLFKFADNKLFKDGVPPVIKEMGEFGKFGSENNPLNEKQLIRGYIRSLYRFFMDNPWGEENRMKYATQIGTCSLFRQAFTLKQQVRFADRAMALGCYNEAETIYNGFEQTTEVMQKLGLAQLKQEKYDKAAFTFDEALALQEDTWTLSQLARCLRQMNQKQKALRVYNRLLTLQPDRKSALQYKAQLLLDLGRNDEAMQVFYQLEALYPNDPNSSRGMGWCAFLTGKDSEAEKYLEQAAYSETATANDLVNYGHLLLATGHRAEALQIYLSARPKLEKNSQLLNMILADKALLEKKGIDQPTLSLLIDTLLRMLKERKQ